MILVTCTIATFVAQRGARNIALVEAAGNATTDNPENVEKILIPINNLDTTDELVNLGTMIMSTKNKNGLYALNIIAADNMDNGTNTNAKKILEKAAIMASATDNHLHQLLRYDLNIVNGISNVVREHEISDLILGLHVKQGISDSFLGNLTEGILTKCDTTTLIYRPVQPMATIKRHLIIVPRHAEKEIGFPFWLLKVWNIGRNSGAKLVFYATTETLNLIREIQARHPVECEFETFDDWEDFLILSRNFRKDDCLIIVMSRKDRLSYQNSMAKIPVFLNTYFKAYSFMMAYPMQRVSLNTPHIDFKNDAYLESLETLEQIRARISTLFKVK